MKIRESVISNFKNFCPTVRHRRTDMASTNKAFFLTLQTTPGTFLQIYGVTFLQPTNHLQLVDKLIIAQLAKIFLALYATRRFITV
jgi:hypothetical protein